MNKFKPAKITGALLLGIALAGLAACDQPAAPTAGPDDSATIETAAPVTISSPTEAASKSAAVGSLKTAPASPATARPARTPTPAPTKSEAAEPADPHAGHDRGSMADDDMDKM